MLSKALLSAVTSFFLLTTITIHITSATGKSTTKSETTETTTSAAASTFVNKQLRSSNSETTTTSLLPLQPPLTVTSTTISSFPHSHEPQNGDEESRISTANVPVRGQSSLRSADSSKDGEVKVPILEGSSVDATRDANKDSRNGSVVSDFFRFGRGFSLPTTPRTSQPKVITQKNAHGYIQFEVNEEEDAEQQVLKRKHKKAENVQAVLTDLFPNGFTDIFRFSYNAETNPDAPEIPNDPATLTAATTTATTEKSQKELPELTTTQAPVISSTTAPENKTFYSFAASVSSEYRREVSPGHTEIVVEKYDAQPEALSDEFKDGTNVITKDELLRINRAASDASVLPSILMEPDSLNGTNDQTLLTSNGPIVILNDDTADMEEDELYEEDNQIAESQNVGSHVFQRLPETPRAGAHKNEPHAYKNARGGYKREPEINVHIVQDDNLKAAQDSALDSKNASLSLPENSSPREGRRAPQELDHFQEDTEKHFQRKIVQEAPSRKFLKHFNPALTEGNNPPVQRGNFHYEVNTPPAVPSEAYSQTYSKPRAQYQYQRTQPQEAQPQRATSAILHTHISHSTAAPNYHNNENYDVTPLPLNTDHVTSKNIVFVTINSTPRPLPQPTAQSSQQSTAPSLAPHQPTKTPHDFVAEAAAAGSSYNFAQTKPDSAPKPNGGYTFVEVQKSINIHNKLITEKDGQLVESHETIYPQPQLNSQPKFSPESYVSLSANPINVQHLDDEGAQQAESAAYAHVEHAPPRPHPPPHPQVQIVEKLVPQPYPVAVEKIVDRPYPVTQVVEKKVPAPYPVKEVVEKVVPQPYPVHVEKIVDRPYPVTHVVEKQVPEPYPVKEYVEKVVEKVVDRPVDVPYAVPVNHYIDRPYAVPEYVETHVPVPYPVPDPIPVHVEHYIDRPYPVEQIIEKHVPYPVETVVEKIVEKHVPVEVERIVEKPVETVVEKFIDRPVAVPIHVPVGVPMPVMMHQTPHGASWTTQHNALGWSAGRGIPHKVLQNYYARMLKKLWPQVNVQKTKPTNSTKIPAKKPLSSSKPTPTKTPKDTDMRFDLRPPPPPSDVSWSQGARYFYNTLPFDLATSAATSQQSSFFIPPKPATASNEAYDEFTRWRNGHSLKRSPDFGRNLHMEYGFKPPLVPSVEIDDKGIPLSVGSQKSDQ